MNAHNHWCFDFISRRELLSASLNPTVAGEVLHKSKMSYALEHRAEFDRLEKQSTLEPYDYKSELAGISIREGASILDAGCGSGIVSRYLATQHPNSPVVGCDFSQPRVQQAQEAADSIENLSFEQQDLRKLTYPPNEFDLVISRYVIEHQIPRDLTSVIAEMARVLKPGGSLLIIDVDGHMHNVHPQTPAVRRGLQKFSAAKKIDLYIGRKIPYLLAQAGLTSISWRIETLVFQSQLKEAEMDLMRTRFENGSSFFEEVLGGKGAAHTFEKEYLECMSHPQAVSFSNKFIVTAVKPLLLRLDKKQLQ
jgi:ubiquinone/menaquinone biosynthesis C-methylase UbiE